MSRSMRAVALHKSVFNELVQHDSPFFKLLFNIKHFYVFDCVRTAVFVYYNLIF